MGKAVNKTDPFAYKPEYNQQVSGASPRVIDNEPPPNDPFAYRPEYNADVKKKVGGTESEVGITEPSPTQSQLQSRRETATDFLVKDISQNDFFSKIAAPTDQYFPHTTPQRVNQQAAEMTQKEIFKNPNSLQRYVGDRIKDLNEELMNIQREKNSLVSKPLAGGGEEFAAFSGQEGGVSNKKRYDELAQTAREKQDYIKKLKNNSAEIASDLILSQMDLSSGVDFGQVGRKITSMSDPEQEAKLKMAEKAGNVLPGITREGINYVGLQAVKSFLARNPNLPNYDQIVKNVIDQENEFDQKNPQTTALRVKEKIGAQLYKEGKGSFFGFGYSPNDLKEVADRAETALTPSEKKIFNEVVLPTERRLIGTDIPTSGFTRSFYNAMEKGAINMGKTVGDVTGLRDEADQARDLLNQEFEGSRYRPAGESPTAQAQLSYLREKEKTGKLNEGDQKLKKELENYTYIRNGWSKFKDGVGDLTGQVAMIALTTKGIGGVGRSLSAAGAEGGLLGGLTRSTVGQALSNETVGLFVSSYLNAFDNYKQQAIDLMPGEDKAANRNAYATVMSSVEALSERIFRDTKVLDAFTKELAPSIRQITNQFINKEITQQVAREETQKAFSSALKGFGKEYLASTGQEATEEAVVDIAQGVADSALGGQPFDIVKTGQQALNTFLTTALYSPLVAGMAASGAVRRHNSQNTFLKSAIVDMAANPAQYLQSVEDLQLDGKITQQEANEKIKLINSANQYLKEIPVSRSVTMKTVQSDKEQVIEQNKEFDYPETSSYLLHRLNEGILTEQIDNTTDEVLKSRLQKDLKRSQEVRKGIFEGNIGVTPNLKEVTDNEEKANELGIFDVKSVQPDELVGTPFAQDEMDVPHETIAPVAKSQQKLPQITEEQTKDATDFTNELLDEGIIPAGYREMAQSNPVKFLEFVAQQAQNTDADWQPFAMLSERAAKNAFGETLVNYAKELFPLSKIKTETDEKQISQEAVSQQSGEEITIPEERADEATATEEVPVLAEQGAEPVAEAPLEISEEGIEEPKDTSDKPRIRVRLVPEGEPIPMSGITHERTEETRKEFGLPKFYEKTEKTDEELEKEADAQIKAGYNIEELISKLEKKHIPSDVETTILKKYKANLEKQIAKNPTDEKLEELNRLVQASDLGGSETARSLRSRQGMQFRDDSLASFFTQDRNANLQAPLTEQQKETVITEHEKITDAQSAYDKKMEQLEAENARLRAEAVISKTKKTSKKTKKTHEDYVEERKAYIDAAREKLKKLRGGSQVTIVPYANELFAIAPEVGKVVRSLVEEGVTNLSEVVKNVHDTFKEFVPELTETDVNNIIAGEYSPQRSRSEVAEILRNLRDEAALIKKYESLLKGENPTSEKAKIKRNQEIEELRKKIKDFKKEQADAEKQIKADQKEANKKTPEEIALQALKTRTKSQINELEEQLRANKFTPDEKKEPLKLDKEATELKDKLIKLRQERQIRLLRTEYDNRSKTRKAFDAAANILNVPRSLMASLDFSAPLRQAVIVTVSNPKTAALAGLEMFQQAWSQKRFDRWFFDLQQTERYKLMQEAGLYVSDPHDPRLSVREEQFMSNLAEKIPLVGRLVKGSERAYVSYLNKMRVDLFNRYADALENDGFTWSNHPEMYEGLAKFLNNSTGRGDLGGLETAAPFLNSAFFSPRLMASRLNILGLNPTYYKSLPPKIRTEALKSLGIFMGVGVATLFLLNTSFGCDGEDDKDCLEVELDPRSSDFGKIRSGKTRWDIWGGFQQYIRVITQAIITGQVKSVTSGQIKELDGEGINRSRGDQLFSFFRGKLAPVPSFVVDRLMGRNILGEKQSFLEAAGSRLIPLVAADLYKSINDNGVRAIFTQGIPATFGVGVQNYLPKGYENKNLKDPVYNFLYDKNINLNAPTKKKEQSDEQYDEFIKDREPIIKQEWEQAIKFGIMINENGNPTIDENDAVKVVPADKATYEQLTGLMKSISNKATRQVKKEDNE